MTLVIAWTADTLTVSEGMKQRIALSVISRHWLGVSGERRWTIARRRVMLERDDVPLACVFRSGN